MQSLNRLHGGERPVPRFSLNYTSLNRLHGGEPHLDYRALIHSSLNRLRGGELLENELKDS